MNMLRPAGDFGRDASGGKLALDRRLDLFDILLAVEAALVEELGDLLVGLGLERPQTEILQLPFELPHAEPVGERREQVLCFTRGLRARRALVRNQVAQRLRALGELDQDDADVLDHRQQHLAQVFRLQVAVFLGGDPGRGANRVHPCRTDHDLRDLGAKGVRECRGIEVGRKRCAEQDGGAHRLGVELERGDDVRRAERAVEPRLAIGRAQIAIASARRVQRLADRGALGRCVRGGDVVDPRGECFRVRGRQRAWRRDVNDGNHAGDYTGAPNEFGPTNSVKTSAPRPNEFGPTKSVKTSTPRPNESALQCSASLYESREMRAHRVGLRRRFADARPPLISFAGSLSQLTPQPWLPLRRDLERSGRRRRLRAPRP